MRVVLDLNTRSVEDPLSFQMSPAVVSDFTFMFCSNMSSEGVSAVGPRSHRFAAWFDHETAAVSSGHHSV